jgi:hypothetical protein
VPRPLPKKISQIAPVLSQVAQSSHFIFEFGGLSGNLREHLKLRGLDYRFIGDNLSLLCCRASLPGSGFATADVVGNFPGVAEKFAHTRTFVQIDLDFYVDTGYRSLKFLEHWMEFISSGTETVNSAISPLRNGYFYRMRYPLEYKCDETRVIKFEKDYKRYVEYRFFGLFPISLNSTPVSYEGSTVLKATASFHYDRYYSGQSRSINELFKTEGNKDPAPSGTGTGNEVDYARLFNSGTVFGENFNFGNVLSNTQRYASNNDLFDDATTILSNTQLRSANFINGGGGSNNVTK